MKKLCTLMLLVCFLVSCGKETVEEVSNEKSDFFVQTTLGSQFSGDTALEKTGKVSSSQDINLTANASGRVAYVNAKQWDNVRAWQVIAALEDNIGSYGINLQRSQNSIERAEINYESNKITLDKQVFDAELNVEKLEQNLQALRKDSEQNILQAQDNLESSQFEWLDSTSALQLQQLDNNIEKAKLDYDIRLVSDEETLQWYKSRLITDYNALLIFLDDIIEFNDELLWVTPLHQDENERIRDFLWKKDTAQTEITKGSLRAAINYRNSSEFLQTDQKLQSGDISESEVIEIINFINSWYEISKTLLNNIEQTINNSVESQWILWESELDLFSNSINTYQGQLQSTYGGFISFGTTVKSFVRTYQDNQASLWKSIELQEKDRAIQAKTLASSEISAETSFERTVITTQDSLTNLESQLQTAKNTLDNAKKTRDVTLRSMQNSIEEAKISYSSSAKEFSKLTITSPINGTVSDVFIDKGQEVVSGWQLFAIVSDATPEVEISFSSLEKELVQVWQEVFIDVWPERITGKIYAISQVADENLNHKATITFDSGASIIWNLVTVQVPIVTNKMLLPINIIETQWDEIGLVKTLSWSSFSNVRVRMGEVFWEYVEIVSCAKQCEELQIIVNDVSNFDENKFVIVEK